MGKKTLQAAIGFSEVSKKRKKKKTYSVGVGGNKYFLLKSLIVRRIQSKVWKGK